ncbi:MAG TPA: glycosyltransferase family A protein [Polyangiaceae bacterium]
MASSPAISIITPSYRREPLLQVQHRTVLRQSEQNFEWLILDDSPEPSSYFSKLSDPRIRYAHYAGARLSIGAKRNWLVDRAQSEFIAHFDDDDFYAKDYLSTMRGRLLRGADMSKLSAWFVYTKSVQKLGYWDTRITRGLHFRFADGLIKPVLLSDENAKAFETHYAGFGFSYVYRKALWQSTPFPEQDVNEDYGMVSAALAKGCKLDHFADTQGLCLHILRQDNTSVCYPQYVLPDFILAKMFPPEVAEQLRA